MFIEQRHDSRSFDPLDSFKCRQRLRNSFLQRFGVEFYIDFHMFISLWQASRSTMSNDLDFVFVPRMQASHNGWKMIGKKNLDQQEGKKKFCWKKTFKSIVRMFKQILVFVGGHWSLQGQNCFRGLQQGWLRFNQTYCEIICRNLFIFQQ